jgi:hypothetical protein
VTDWETVASFATAGGTLVLAAATFSAIRSSNRSARIAERSFQIGLRPILTASRLEDPPQRIMFGDRHWVNLEGGRAVVEFRDEVIYLAMLVRNVGSGMAMIEAWQPHPGQGTMLDDWGKIEDFTSQIRALWIAPGDVAFWQGALRDPSQEIFGQIREAVSVGALYVDVLYRDHEGGQRTMSRFSMMRRDDEDGEDSGWWSALSRHHQLDVGPH